jgi:hypothetical protein
LKKNIKLIFVWVGKKDGTSLIEWKDLFWNTLYKKDSTWQKILTKFDEKFFKSFSFDTYKIDTYQDISKMDIKNIPSSIIETEMNKTRDISRYLMMISYICLLLYIALFSYFEKKWK